MSIADQTSDDVTEPELSRSEGLITSSQESSESAKYPEEVDNVRLQEEYHSAECLTEGKIERTSREKEKQIDPQQIYGKLQKQLDLFKNSNDFKLIEKYDNKLKKKLLKELEELDFTMKEIGATVENILRMKKQRYYVKKELSKMTKNLSKSKQEELKEMEVVVAVYDKELLRRWHLMKKTNSPHSLEGFLNSVIGKRQSIDIIYKMAKERLEALKKKGATSSFPALADKIINEEEPFQEDSLSEE